MAAKCYIEFRKAAARGTESIIADVMRHLHTRQHLGKAVVIYDQPLGAVSAARKQWLKLSRVLQKERSSTLNADKILKFTHSITRMQHMHFSSKSPLENPEADIYFLTPQDLHVLPVHCWSVYVITPIDLAAARTLPDQLPADALIIDYTNGQSPWDALDLPPKRLLEIQVTREWRQVQRFLETYNIDASKLIVNGIHNVEAMDDALDTLLSMSHRFLEIAQGFQHTLELARPLRLSKNTRSDYDSFILLAHRVQALTPGAFNKHFLEAYNENDTFFLYDANKGRLAHTGETLAEAFHRHTKAGRTHLARSLQTLSESPV